MKKYNLSSIMKRAWELVKKSAMTISSGLKEAWREAKGMCKELPELVGSVKQIAWAEDIRKKMIEYGNSLVEYHNINSSAKKSERIRKTVDVLSSIKEASWFIDNREYAIEPRRPDAKWYENLRLEGGREDDFYESLKDYRKEMEEK